MKRNWCWQCVANWELPFFQLLIVDSLIYYYYYIFFFSYYYLFCLFQGPYPCIAIYDNCLIYILHNLTSYFSFILIYPSHNNFIFIFIIHYVPSSTWKSTSPLSSPPVLQTKSLSSHTTTGKWNSTTKIKSLKLSLISIQSFPFDHSYSSETSLKFSKNRNTFSSKFSVSPLLRNSLHLLFPTKSKTIKFTKRNRLPSWLSSYLKLIRCEKLQQIKAEPRISKFWKAPCSFYKKKSPSTNKRSARKSTTTSWRKKWRKKTKRKATLRSSSKP